MHKKVVSSVIEKNICHILKKHEPHLKLEKQIEPKGDFRILSWEIGIVPTPIAGNWQDWIWAACQTLLIHLEKSQPSMQFDYVALHVGEFASNTFSGFILSLLDRDYVKNNKAYDTA